MSVARADTIEHYRKEITRVVVSFGMQPLLTPELRSKSFPGLYFVDQIYQEKNKAVLFKFMQGKYDNKSTNRFITKQSGFMYSLELGKGIAASFFFYHMTKHESKRVIDQIQKSVASTASPWQKLILESAEASEVNCSKQSSDVLFTVGEKLDQDTIDSIAWTCAAAAGDGVKNKANETIDMVSPSNLANLADIDLEKFWDESVKTYETLQELLPQLKPMLKELSQLLDQFHPKLKLNLLCSAVGSQVVDVITPGGVIKKLVILKSKITGLKKLMESLKALSKLYEKFPRSQTLEKATQRIGACAL